MTRAEELAEADATLVKVGALDQARAVRDLVADSEALAEALQGAFNWIGVDEDEAKNDPNTPPVILNGLSVLARYRGEKP